jgi:hypothetical protein
MSKQATKQGGQLRLCQILDGLDPLDPLASDNAARSAGEGISLSPILFILYPHDPLGNGVNGVNGVKNFCQAIRTPLLRR